MLDNTNNKLRVSILEKLKKKGAPSIGPFPEPISDEEISSNDGEETLNDLGPSPELKDRLSEKPRKKKLPLEDRGVY